MVDNLISFTIALGSMIVLSAIYITYAFNKIIQLNLRVDNAEAQIDVELKRRYDLIPLLVSAIKGYAKHEQTVIAGVTAARGDLIKGNLTTKARANQITSYGIQTILAATESYPKLKASENFLRLQNDLADIESTIAFRRQFYNDSVMLHNRFLSTFPHTLLAKIFRFENRDFFEVKAEDKFGPGV